MVASANRLWLDDDLVHPSALPTTLYVVGPMSGHPDFNRPVFDAAQAYLRSLPRYLTVVTPFDNGVPIAPLQPYGDYFRADLALIASCDGIVLLPGWATSRGALVEVQIASACGLPLYYLAPDARGLVAMQ